MDAGQIIGAGINGSEQYNNTCYYSGEFFIYFAHSILFSHNAPYAIFGSPAIPPPYRQWFSASPVQKESAGRLHSADR